MKRTRWVKIHTLVIMSGEVLSDAQFAESTNKAGASRDARTMQPAPSTGHYVSTPDLEEIHDQPVTAGDVDAHRQRILSTHGDQARFQGGWTDEDGKHFLDHSVRVLSRNLALSMGQRNGQKSIYDATHDEVIPVNDEEIEKARKRARVWAS